MHPCHLVFEHRSEPLVGSKRAAEDASDGGSVRILCDVCETTHKLGEGSQIFGNFMRSHLLKPAHEQAAARRAAAARDAEVLPRPPRPRRLLPSAWASYQTSHRPRRCPRMTVRST